MKGLLDNDILLDIALARQPHVECSAQVLRWVEAGGSGAVAGHSLANCAYRLKNSARPFLEDLLGLVVIAPVATSEAQRAPALPMRDLKDAFQDAAALAWGADFITTRNLADYRNSPVPAVAPAAFLKKIA